MEQGSMKIITWTVIFIVIIFTNTSSAYDLTDSISIEATATAILQHADLDNVLNEAGNEISDTGRSAAILDIGVKFHPTDNDEFQIIYSFAEGEAINGIDAFSLAPFADDLEEDLSNINSSDRYNLLEAWYKHTFNFSEQTSLGITAGIISSSGYIDENEYDRIIDLLKYDKKNNHGNINFVLLEAIGKTKIDCLVDNSIIIDAFNFYKN